MRPALIVAAAVVVPGSGHVLLGRPWRGLIFLFWMIIFGVITFHLTTVAISPVGRLSGGLAVWALSIVEAYRLACRPRPAKPPACAPGR